MGVHRRSPAAGPRRALLEPDGQRQRCSADSWAYHLCEHIQRPAKAVYAWRQSSRGSVRGASAALAAAKCCRAPQLSACMTCALPASAGGKVTHTAAAGAASV